MASNYKTEEEHFDELFENALDEYCKQVHVESQLVETTTSDIINKFKNFQPIEFNQPEYIIAYFNRYSTLNASAAKNRIKLALQNCNELQEIVCKTELKIISLGGGPGTDMIGFLSAISSYRSLSSMTEQVTRPSLNLKVSDIGDWKDLHKIIKGLLLKKQFGNVTHLYNHNEVNFSFKQSDINNPNGEELHAADIVLLVRVLGVFPFGQERRILQGITRFMQKDALLLIVDFREKLNNCEGMPDLDILHRDLPNVPEKFTIPRKLKKFNIWRATEARCNTVVCRKR